jgi:hypothetical protein
MRFVTLGILMIGLSTLLGCASQPPLVVQCKGTMKGDRSGTPALVGQEYGPQFTPMPLNSVQFSNWDTAKSLSVQRLFASRTPGGTVAVAARFISCSDAEMAIKVRTSFMDSNQMPTETASAWQTVFLQPRLTATYEEKSTARNVANYLIEIMPN